MSEENKKVAIAFYEKALNDRDVETAFRLYAGKHHRQHNPLVEDGQEGVRKFAKWIGDNHPNAHGEISARLQTAISSFCSAIGSA